MNEIELINKIIARLGQDATLRDAIEWLSVEENAKALRAEGHE